MDLFKKQEDRANTILKTSAEEIAALEQKIIEANNRLKDLEDTITAATDAGNLKDYRKAKEDQRAQIDAREMYSARLKKLSEEPLMKAEDYQKACAEISSIIAEESKAADGKLLKLAGEMKEIADELKTKVDAANSLLKKYQHEIYRDADRSKGENGAIMMLSGEEKTVYNDKEMSIAEVIAFGRKPSESYHYEQKTGIQTTQRRRF